MITLKCTDRVGEDGKEILQSFDNEHAQRILDVKHPMKGWILADKNFKMEAGKIVPAKTTEKAL